MMRDILNGLVLAAALAAFAFSIQLSLTAKSREASFRAAYEATREALEAMTRTRGGAVEAAFTCKRRDVAREKSN
jgi:NADH:ubiquinone oxidoreductase subunit 3 (subunit A)